MTTGVADHGGTQKSNNAGMLKRVLTPRNVIVALVVAVVLWFVIVNGQETTITFWVTKLQAPLWLTLLGTFLAGVVTGYLLRGRKKS